MCLQSNNLHTLTHCLTLTVILRVLLLFVDEVAGSNATASTGRKERYYNIGVLMASRLDSPFDLERCGPAVDLALEDVNEKFLAKHGIRLKKVQAR